jgi:hypothetical protein
VTTVDVRAEFPAASSAVTVMVLSPLCNSMPLTAHVACNLLPESAALPDPPRSLDHHTRCSRWSSVARPLSVIRATSVIVVWLSMATVGGL